MVTRPADWLADRRGRDAARREELRWLIHESARDVQRYASGKTMLALAQGVLITASAALLGVPDALALGLINFVGAYVPRAHAELVSTGFYNDNDNVAQQSAQGVGRAETG